MYHLIDCAHLPPFEYPYSPRSCCCCHCHCHVYVEPLWKWPPQLTEQEQKERDDRIMEELRKLIEQHAKDTQSPPNP